MEQAFEKVEKALKSLQLFRQHYASSEEYQRHLQQVVSLLRVSANNTFASDPGNRKVLLAFAYAIEESNKPGEFVVPSP